MVQIKSGEDGKIVSAKVGGDIIEVLNEVCVAIIMLAEAVKEVHSKEPDTDGVDKSSFVRAMLRALVETLAFDDNKSLKEKYSLISESIEEFESGEITKRFKEFQESKNKTEEKVFTPKLSLEEILEIIKKYPKE